MPSTPARRLLPVALGALCTLSAPAAAQQPALLGGLEDLAAGKHRWEGAIGAVVGEGPAYIGSSHYSFGIKPALFLRYGRFSLSTGAGFTTRRADQVPRGAGVDVVSTDTTRVALALKLDGGRDESSAPQLAGMGDVDSTVRLRVQGTWRPLPGWVFGAAASFDLLGHDQGTQGELSFAREVPLTPDTVWSWGGSLTAGDGTYMRSYYGVTATQSAASGYPVYTPGAGLRDLALSTGLRSELWTDWVGFVNVGMSQSLGPLLDSPLVTKPLGWGINAGLAWRF